MKKGYAFVFSALMVVTFFSCGNNTGSQERIDSLETALAQRTADYQKLDEYITIISTSLDSIAMQETGIFDSGKESPMPNYDQIKRNLDEYRQTLKNQRERIGQLEKKLKSEGATTKKLQGIITMLNAQLAEKEQQIAMLSGELSEKNVSIAHLKARMNELTRQTVLQNEVITSQNKMIQTQDDIINEGFVKIASKAELKQSGLLSGGFLKKSKVDYSQVDKRQFRSVDTRVVTEIEINSKKPKILTDMPADSYTLEQNGDKSLLRITNPTRFWSVSKFLIVQI